MWRTDSVKEILQRWEAVETYLSNICETCQWKCTRISFATDGTTCGKKKGRRDVEMLLRWCPILRNKRLLKRLVRDSLCWKTATRVLCVILQMTQIQVWLMFKTLHYRSWPTKVSSLVRPLLHNKRLSGKSRQFVQSSECRDLMSWAYDKRNAITIL